MLCPTAIALTLVGGCSSALNIITYINKYTVRIVIVYSAFQVFIIFPAIKSENLASDWSSEVGDYSTDARTNVVTVAGRSYFFSKICLSSETTTNKTSWNRSMGYRDFYVLTS